MLNKWYIDEIYNATFVKGVLLLSNICKWFDITIIDGIVNGSARIIVLVSWFYGKFDTIVIDGLVNAVALITQLFGLIVRQFQTGRIQQYIVGLLIGMMIIIMFRIM